MLLAVPTELFLRIYNKSRVSENEILVEHLRTFKLLETMAYTTLTTFVYEMCVVRSYDPGSIIRKKI